MKATVLLFSIWMMKIKAQCPASCNCTTTSISCVEKNLESIPNLRSTQSSPLILDFSGNQLLFISKTDFDFPKSKEVKEIYLNNSDIADIGKGTFDKLENLQELYLGQNLLAKVPSDMIEKLQHLILLDMSGNLFQKEMPLIKSRSLEVLALVDSKITTLQQNVLYELPNLKLLILNQNDITTLGTDPFLHLPSHSIFVKLQHNPLTCSCGNLETYYYLQGKGLLFDEETYECVDDDQYINILNISGQCGQEDEASVLINQIRDMVSDVKDEDDNSYDYELEIPELDIQDLNDRSLEVSLLNGCWEFDHERSSRIYAIILVFTMASFLVGFVAGAIFSRIIYTLRYRKLEQSSDSHTQLLGA